VPRVAGAQHHAGGPRRAHSLVGRVEHLLDGIGSGRWKPGHPDRGRHAQLAIAVLRDDRLHELAQALAELDREIDRDRAQDDRILATEACDLVARRDRRSASPARRHRRVPVIVDA
jgi:hypothetical protein